MGATGSFSPPPIFTPTVPLVQSAGTHPRLWSFCSALGVLQGLPMKQPPTSWKLPVLHCCHALVHWVTSSVEPSARTDPFPGPPGNPWWRGGRRAAGHGSALPLCSVGNSPFTRAMFSPRPTLSLTLLMSLAGGQSLPAARLPCSTPVLADPAPLPTPVRLRSSHPVLQADLGSNDVGSSADHAEGQVLLGTRLRQAAFVLPGPRLWVGTTGVTHGPGPGGTRDLRGGGQDQPIGRNE